MGKSLFSSRIQASMLVQCFDTTWKRLKQEKSKKRTALISIASDLK